MGTPVRISLCMIVRDEAQNLGRCLESVKAVVDEVCVLDTGSTDGTAQLARGLGARVEEFSWCDDFSAARNASLEMARGDWVLVLDADEVLVHAGARAKLESFVAEHATAIGRVQLWNTPGAGSARGSTIPISRFFPRDPALSFVGRVHEQLMDDSRDRARLDTGVEVLHHGYAPEQLTARRKLDRNRDLLRAALEDTPQDPYPWFQLGLTEFLTERHEAAWCACSRAIELLRGRETPYIAQLFETAAYSLRHLGRSDEALALLSQIAARFSGRSDTRFLLALLAMDTGRLADAEAGFRACLELEGSVPEGGESARSSSTWAPAFNLGVMNEVLQHTAEAVRWYQRALDYHPGHAASAAALLRCR